jgi:hypothetical protein
VDSNHRPPGPEPETASNQQLSANCTDRDPLLQAPIPQSVSRESDSDRSNGSQRVYAQTGHSIGHSPAIENSPSTGLCVSQLIAPLAGGGRNLDLEIGSVVEAFLKGKNPDEIHAERQNLRLSQVYGIISLYLERRERPSSMQLVYLPDPHAGSDA